jgi:hypothetical protein
MHQQGERKVSPPNPAIAIPTQQSGHETRPENEIPIGAIESEKYETDTSPDCTI